MTFVSVQFGILLLVALAGFSLLPQRGRILFLLAASYIFYAFWNPWYAILILFSTTIDFFAARFMESSDSPRHRKVTLWISIIGNLGLLGYFKYTNFGLHILHDLFGTLASPLPQALDILLPVGISFYTFQSMSYTIDVYRGRLKAERDFPTFALFVAFFPQLVAGPIERAHDLLPQLRRFRTYDPAIFESGVRLLLWGFAKKLIIADRLLLIAQPMLMDPVAQSALDLLFGALALFTMLYFDFSAYTDMARGVAAMFGVRLSENFHLPMAATSIAEFWRGWHITLSSWIRDYVYIPLGGGQPKGLSHQAMISLFTMALVGLWHGANWTFIAWGLQHGIFMVLYQVYFLKIRRRWRRSSWINSTPYALLGWAMTMLLHALSMVWFFSPSIQHASNTLGWFFSPGSWVWPQHSATMSGYFVLFLLWALHALSGRLYPLNKIDQWPSVLRAAFMLALIVAIIGFGVPQSKPFVYFQF